MFFWSEKQKRVTGCHKLDKNGQATDEIIFCWQCMKLNCRGRGFRFFTNECISIDKPDKSILPLSIRPLPV